jgi:hypothetical protein
MVTAFSNGASGGARPTQAATRLTAQFLTCMVRHLTLVSALSRPALGWLIEETRALVAHAILSKTADTRGERATTDLVLKTFLRWSRLSYR